MELLEALVTNYKVYAVALKGDDALLQPAFDELVRVGLVAINGKVYEPTKNSRAVVKRFLERKQDCTAMLGVYTAVDIEEGAFAWETGSRSNSTEHMEVLAEERWQDLCLTVAEYKGLDLDEIAFMLTFNMKTIFDAWQKELMDPKLWSEIDNYQRLSLKVSDLNFEDWEGSVDGKEVIAAIIKFGARIIQANPLPSSQPKVDKDFDVVLPKKLSKKTLENYLKPGYVNPCWHMNLLTGKTEKAAQEFYWK